ncbi:hypothetical protein U9M48_031941, partial [Paspalum notatum var. saurae]
GFIADSAVFALFTHYVRIDPSNAFRLIIKTGSYKANLEYGTLEIEEQHHDHWIDSSRGYSMQDFIDDMATKIIWGPSHELEVWGIDTESGSEWKVRDNAAFERMIECRLDEKVMHLTVDVVEKQAYKKGSHLNAGSSSHAISGVTHGGVEDETGDCTGNSPDASEQPFVPYEVDWDTLVVAQDEAHDGDPTDVVDEAAVYMSMGFEAKDREAAEKADEAYAIPCMTAEMEKDFSEASILVDDNDMAEPIADWDRDNPDMSVGAVYPSMDEFRLAIKQWSIVHEFSLGTEKSHQSRWRGFCKAKGYPWKLTTKTQGDSSVRVQIIKGKHNCASSIRGSVVEIDTVQIQGKKHFSRFFCCFKACIDGFLGGCRPYLSIDSTALNGLAVVHQLNAASKGLTHLRITKGNSEQAEDEAMRRHVVYLKDHHCTCRQWQISGKLCPHALAVITTDRQPNMEPYVDQAYSIARLQAACAGCLPNITDKEQWPQVDKGFHLLPPVGKPRPLGKQRKNRILGALERSGKTTRQSKCHGCGQLGHRKGSWRFSLTGTKKRIRAAAAREAAMAAQATAEAEQATLARRRLALDAEATPECAIQTTHQEAAPEHAPAPEPKAAPQPAKKMTPVKKRVCTKVRKTPAKK